MANRIFISYRREDSRGSAGRIYDHLTAHFDRDQIFMDVDTIQPGLDFVDVISSAVSKVDVLIAVIGPDWLSASDTSGKRRLDHPEDFVRLEIATALERNIRVIPVLVEGAKPPRNTELPDNLKLLARRNAIEITHNRFYSDIQRLVRALKLTLGEDKKSDIEEPGRDPMTEPYNTPVSLSQEEQEEQNEVAEKMATCPFVGTAVATGQLQMLNTAENPLASIDEVARLGDLGGGDLGTHVLKLFARGNHSRIPGDIHALVPTGTFSLQFGGSQGAHAGHSGILLGNPDEVGRGRFDQGEFKRLVAHADRNGRLSIDSIGDFIADNLKRDPNAQVLPAWQLIKDAAQLLSEFKDVVLGEGNETQKTEAFEALTKLLSEDNLAGSAGEWGLLFAFLKNSPNSDDGDIALSDVKVMFVDKQFPIGWETWAKSTLDWIKATLQLIKDASFAYHAGLE